MGPAAAVAGLVISAAGAYKQHQQAKEQKKAVKEQAREAEKQAKIAQRQADIQNARTVRANIRQARIARAAIVNAGANAGTLGSSAVAGGVGSVDSQLQSNLSFFNESNDLNQAAIASQARSGQAQADQQIAQATSASWGALGQLGGTIFQGGGGFKTIFDVVNPPKAKT